MKNLLYILTAFALFGCGNPGNKDISTPSDRLELIPEPDKNLKEEFEESIVVDSQHHDSVTCSGTSGDFLKLKDKKLQTDLFSKIDSIRKVQYPEDNQETSISVDLRPEYLNRFMEDLDKDSLQMNNEVEKQYHFNIAPKSYIDPKECKDDIRLSFEKVHCQFRLEILNSFLVEPNWCTESMVVYGFKIENGKIIDF